MNRRTRRMKVWAAGLCVTLVLAVSSAKADTTSSISANFNGTAITSGDSIWFSSVLKPSGLGSSPVTIFVRNSTISFTANGTNYSVPVPNSNIIFSPSATSATVSFSSTNNLWQITVPSSGLAGNTLLDAVKFAVPQGGLPGGIQNVTWKANFSADSAGISLQWQWAAAVYSSVGTDYNALGVKPVDDNNASSYQNSDHAGTPENYKTDLVGGATGGGGSNFTGGYSGTASLAVPVAQAPNANAGGPYNGVVGQTISLSGAGSSDPNGYPLSYSWNFGDSTTGTGVSPTHAYSSAGTFTITLSVTDGRTSNGTATATATITLPPPPSITAALTPPPNANGWNNASVTVSFTCTDSVSGVKSCSSPVTLTMQGGNQLVTGSAVNNADETSTVNAQVNIDETAPTITAASSPTPDSAGWNNSNVTVTFTCSDSLSGIAQCPSPILVSASGANQVISGTATDKAGNTASATVSLSIEETPPSIVASVSPPPNAKGWNNSNVTVSFACTQSTSPITTCPSPQVVSTEGANQVITGTATDAAQNSNTAKVTLNIAKIPPKITLSSSPAANANGWNNTSVTVSFACAATTAPLATCSQSQTVTTEGANQVVTGIATDVAGNTATAKITLNIGETPPAITATASPSPNSKGWNNSSVTVSFTCTPGTAPIATCPQSQTVGTEGANQVGKGTVTDLAGNTATAQTTFSIATTPPKITAAVSPPPNSAGWNNSTVTVSFICTNTTAPIASCPPSQTISSSGANQVVSGTASDAAGNTATAVVTLNIEMTPPAMAASVSPAPNSSGWNNSSVKITYICSAATSPIVTCPQPQTVSTEGANQIVCAQVLDAAGNTAPVCVTLNIDLTPPTLSITSPANGATFASPALSVTGNVSDALSGLSAVTCNGTSATVQTGSFTCSATLNAGANTIAVQATDVAGNTSSQSVSVTYASGPTISSFSPSSAPAGSLITVAGSGFTANGAIPLVTLNQQGSGTIPAPVSSFNGASLSFVIPTGAATGPIAVSVNGQSATSSTSLTVVSSSTFTLTAVPGSATLLPGQTTTFQVSLASTNGFSQLAALSVTGVPAGVTASFQPAQITAGQFSILTLTGSNTLTPSSAQLTITAGSTVQGIPQSATATVGLNLAASGNVAFGGRVAVTHDPYDRPIAGLTVRFTGTNYSGAPTGCSASTTTDSSGNFLFASLPDACGGAQLVQYDPSTVTSPPGTYSGVNLSYVLTPGQVTTPGIVVHLPRVDNAETALVAQNSSTDQVFTFKSIPSLMMVVYAGTTFSLADGTQPDPFPLRVVEIPYDRLPEKMQPDPTQDPVFAMSIEPFNSSSSQPVAVFYPNRSNTPPGTNMPLTSLSPVLGTMVNYGTGTVSVDGTQIIPDLDPAYPGHAYGISHFDWFFFLPPPPNNKNPSPDPKAPKKGDPVDTSSGLLVITKTDLAFGGARGQVEITRTYRSLSSNLGPFGRGSGHNYNYFLDLSSLGSGFSAINLIMPDQNQFLFAQQSDGTFINSTIPSLAGAVISPAGGTYKLRWKNGAVFQFQALNSGFAATGAAYLVAITDANGNTTTLVRNSTSEIMQIIDPVGRTTNLAYDLDSQGHIGLITSITDPIGRTIRYGYDVSSPCGTLTSVKDANGGITTYAYDSACQLTSITDPRGVTYLQNFYDQNGRVVKQVAADGGVTTFSYTPLNPSVSITVFGTAGATTNVNTSPTTLTAVTDPLGNQTTYHYNPVGFLVDVTDALGQKIVYTVDPATNRTTGITDPLGRTTAFTYDAAGNTTSSTRLSGTPNAVTTTFTYEPTFNKVATATDPLGRTTVFRYDSAGNLVSVTDPLNEQISYVYDNSGELTAMKDPLGNVTHFAYVNGDLVTITDPLGRASMRISDGVGRTIRLTNPIGQSLQYQFSALNQLAQITDPSGNSTLFTYDGNGNLLGLTDSLGHKTTYSYDSMDMPATRTDPLGHTESYQHDRNGNLTQFTDRRGVVTTSAYDGLNRRTLASFGSESSVGYSYDAASRLTQTVDSITGPIVRSYDGLDRLVSEVTMQGSISYSYDAGARRLTMSASGQSPVNYSYDGANRVTQIAQGSLALTFAYDADGRRTSLTLPNGVTTSYSYDAASQLIGINYLLGTSTLGSLTYSYDLSGRRTSVGGGFARTGLPQTVSSTGYNANNQLTQWKGASLTYDANGNLTGDGTNTYTWNARNQLATISGGVSASFQYDPFGRRVSKTSLTTTQYLYDGMNPAQELSGGSPSSNLLNGGADEHFQRTDSAGTSSFLTDALGNTIALIASGGTTLLQYTYDPYGNTSASANSSNSYQYTGRENDGTGLYYYRARYYSPQLQRFISEDPVGFSGGDANLYAYAGTDPIDHTDPTGFFWPNEHRDITIEAALNVGMSPEDAIALGNAVAAVDSRLGTQEDDAYDANTHAMAGRKPNGNFQTCEQAQAGTEQQIADALQNGDLAKALHTVEDSYSPSHTGYQQWDGGWNLFYVTAFFGSASGQHVPGPSHILGDLHLFNDAPHQQAVAAVEGLLQFPGLSPRTFLPRNACGSQ